MNFINQLLQHINDLFYVYILVFLLIFSGIYFTIKSDFVQFKLFKEALRILNERPKNSDAVSSFQALMISTASRVGTGNIAGVASALALGGEGALFWMWIIALIGSASAFIESTLAQIYKVKDENTFQGGPAYYIRYALNDRNLGILFAVLLILCFCFGFNPLQAYNVKNAFEHYSNQNLLISIFVGIVLAILMAMTIFKGIQKIGDVSAKVVPIMSLLYILLGFYIIVINIDQLPNIFIRIIQKAFDFQAIMAGFTSSAMMYGIKRGLFSNEAGMGSAPNAAGCADVSHPVKQGLVQMLSVFIDTLIICSTTGLMLLMYDNTAGYQGMTYVQQAVSFYIGELGIHFITISIFLFAFSSLIGNYCYAESNLKFITHDKKILFWFRIICVVAVFLGALSDFELVWNLADVLMGLMALLNIIVILKLSKIAIIALRDYRSQLKKGVDPEFDAKKLNISNTQVW